MPRLILNSVNIVRMVEAVGRPVAARVRAAAIRIVNSSLNSFDTKLIQNMFEFFRQYDFLVTPGAIVAAFPREQCYVKECAGHQFQNYLEWMAMGYAITLVDCPAILIPCGFSTDGIPVGLQIVGLPGRKAELLVFARKIEMLVQVNRGPIDPRSNTPS